MTTDTIAINQRMRRFDACAQVWLFGYGSLIFRPDFVFIERRRAVLHHWSRRFWQGSHDHRGTRTAPGRVVTLVEEPGASCSGMAYLITPAVFAHLDAREKNGYLRVACTLVFDDGGNADALVYVAEPGNGAWLGPASEREIAAQIASARGPSGRNRDYLTALADALRELRTDDVHVFSIERHLHRIGRRR